jgi:FAD/FMN-containing dehydrogenase
MDSAALKIEGDVHSDPKVLEKFSKDASSYRILPSLWKYAGSKGWILPSIIDDVAIHLEDLGSVMKGLNNLMERLNHKIAYFGHLGFGSIHARPFFNSNSDALKEQIMTVSHEAFNIIQPFNGTLVGEHNAGRSRSVYLKPELGSAFKYLRKIKTIFDPDNILNPGALFDTEPIYAHMDLTR